MSKNILQSKNCEAHLYRFAAGAKILRHPATDPRTVAEEHNMPDLTYVVIRNNCGIRRTDAPSETSINENGRL